MQTRTLAASGTRRGAGPCGTPARGPAPARAVGRSGMYGGISAAPSSSGTAPVPSGPAAARQRRPRSLGVVSAAPATEKGEAGANPH